MANDPARLVEAAIARLVGGDPLAAELLAAAVRRAPDSFEAVAAFALVSDRPATQLRRAQLLARTRRQRQHLAVIESWLGGDRERSRMLAREHLAEFPDDLVLSWVAGRT